MTEPLSTEHSCLQRLRAGEDAWPEFLDLFGGLMYWEVAKHGVIAGHDRDDLLQDVALKLMAHDWAIVQRHLENHSEMTFSLVLRTIIRSCLINMWRRNKRWREMAQLDDEPQLDEIAAPTWACNPAQSVYRDVRLMCWLQDLAGSDRDGRNYRILYLRFIEDESVTDIAGMLGLSANAVTQRIRECLKRGRRAPGAEALWRGQGV